ncbi:MAG: hypothetical protein KAT56_02965 [Sedimentisphaerales bacterium]|nr:hypothetical protein [Sedimentisphaerales bacterium]
MKQVNYRKANLRSVIIMAIALMVGFGLLGFCGSVNAADIYVSTSGTDCSTCGSQGNPCRHIEYAVEQRAVSGDTVRVSDGTYTENQIQLPEGVSLTSANQDASRVIIQPATTQNTYRRYPLILFQSTIGTNNPSGQVLSYITLDGDGVFNNGPYYVEAINVHDRDNVEIAHCVIKDFYKQSDFHGSNTVVAQSSKDEGNTQNWWDIWPSDPGLDGDDSSFDGVWPGTAVEHVQNFQFHHNIMRNCGNKIEDRSQANIGLWMVKDSEIYNNDIDTAGCPGTQGITGTWPGSGPSVCLWNVDFHHNDIKVDLDTDFLGWYSVGTIEIWLMRGGCEFYENNCNQGWSITRGKNTTIRDNIIIGNPHSDCSWKPDNSNTTFRGSWGFELDGQSYLDAHNNYLEGTSGGFKLGSNHRSNIVRTGRIYNNFIVYICGRPFSPAASKGSQVLDYKIYNNTADGRYSTNVDGRGNFQYSCISVANKGVGSVLEVDFENNIFTDARASYLGLGFCDGQAAYSDINVINTLYDDSLPNFWRDTDGGVACGTNITGSIQDDPLYTKTGQNAEYYKLQSDSPAINAGVNVNLTNDYWGTARPQGAGYDIGAFEYALRGDLDGDGCVDLEDLAMFAEFWLKCNDPQNPNCEFPF